MKWEWSTDAGRTWLPTTEGEARTALGERFEFARDQGEAWFMGIGWRVKLEEASDEFKDSVRELFEALTPALEKKDDPTTPKQDSEPGFPWRKDVFGSVAARIDELNHGYVGKDAFGDRFSATVKVAGTWRRRRGFPTLDEGKEWVEEQLAATRGQ